MKIPDNRLDRLFARHRDEYEAAALRALRSGWYVLGEEVKAFETEFTSRINAEYCAGLNSGLDALVLAIRALGIGAGDEVIVPANTYIATVLGITENGAAPVFVEPDAYHNLDANLIEAAVTPKTKAILVVHLYGQAANMEPICEIAKRNGLYLIEDCAQSHTAKCNGKMTGTFGDIGCYSFFPTKNLGAFRDGGAVVSNNAEIIEKIKKLRNYGSKVKYKHEIDGVNSRLDELQAALLRARLPYLDEITAERRAIAEKYLTGIHSGKIILPQTREGSEHVWHLFVVKTNRRDELQAYLQENGIKTQIHYPTPPHLSPCYARLGYGRGSFPVTERIADEILSLPLYNGMTDEEIQYVVDCVNRW